MNVFLLQLRSLLDGAEITATAVRSRSFRAIFPLKHQIVSRTAALGGGDDCVPTLLQIYLQINIHIVSLIYCIK